MILRALNDLRFSKEFHYKLLLGAQVITRKRVAKARESLCNMLSQDLSVNGFARFSFWRPNSLEQGVCDLTALFLYIFNGTFVQRFLFSFQERNESVELFDT